MLDPTPARTEATSYPKPAKILSRSNLYLAWKSSRDATSNPGRPGIDGLTAERFGARIEEQISALSSELRTGTYRPYRLRPVFIPKPDSSKERLICIPAVRDRVVQKAIVSYLVTTEKFPIENEFSFGFVRGRGTLHAIERALELRNRYAWCLKTDIEAFFDRISRSDAKLRVSKSLKNSSLTPLVHQFIDCEIKSNITTRSKLLKQGIVAGRGLRQGMPLSPILANLVLSEFDAAFRRERIDMVRYADDLLVFFNSKRAAREGFEFIKAQLGAQGLTIPELGDESSKTQIVASEQPVSFLGLQLAYSGSRGGYVKKVGRKLIAKIRARLENEFNFDTLRKQKVNFQQANTELSIAISSCLSAYRGTDDFMILNSELRHTARKVLEGIYEDVFGVGVLDNVSLAGREFLGLGSLALPAENSDPVGAD
ncbi:reverse transcriptase domain-containing protein [Bradyrhizobium sp. SZCCHNRI20481]|uniref:reverse transcriptase domain-containing protein n=1 Tax=Bradyrhizobium sp. SZCCHNRI20481 TaxID=3057286 RepID=UPI0029167096|nr:reverse transcriptase domain-containing protein [Bradyrhizobium sp. SZCCHNRI20481]